jgi:hypothetical protein
MRKLIQSTVESLHYLFSGDPDEKQEVPFNRKLQGVILYSIIVGIAIFFVLVV